jgi:hypothetical protein
MHFLLSAEEAMTKTMLNDLVAAYRASGQGRDLIMEKVAVLVYESHARYGFDDEDDAANALLKFRDRIARLVDRFEDRGLPFDAYLATSLRYLARTARRERRRAAERESLCERAAFPEIERIGAEGAAAEPIEPAAPAREGRRCASGRRPRAKGGIVRRCPAEEAAHSSRLVFLAIKCAWEIDEAGVARVAEAAGVGRDWLAAAIEQARRSLEDERSRVERLAERRNASWTRLRLLEARLAGENEGCRGAALASALAREEARYSRVKEELAALRTIVPNSVVARILGIPKGTVDSGLYYLKKRYGGAAGRGSPVPSCLE